MLIYDHIIAFSLLSSRYTRPPLSAVSTGQDMFSRSAVLEVKCLVSAVGLTQLLVLSEHGVLGTGVAG